MKNVFVYGVNTVNVGDDLFMRILFERYPKTRMIMYASNVYTSLFKDYQNVVIISETESVVKRLIRVSHILHIPPTLLVYAYLFKKYRIDLFLVVGGSLFMEGKSNISKTLKKIKLLKLRFPKLKTAIIGSNFGPYKTRSFYDEVKKSLRDVDDVCFRDEASYHAFADLSNIRWGNDIVFHKMKDTVLTKERRVCINIRSVEKWPTLKPFKSNYLGVIKSLITRFQSKGYVISLMSFCERYGDNDISDELYDSLTENNNVERIYYNGDNLSEIVNHIAASEYLIGTRFHAIILGLVYNLKVLPISYSIKTENMLKSLGYWDDIYEFSAFCNSTSDELNNHYLHDVYVDSSKNVQFDWLDKFLA